jgi:2'-5' RNA ligase
MGLLVISYPEIARKDWEWIQSFRQKHDSNYELVSPHISLVFEVSDIEPDEFISHAQLICGNCPAIDFRLRSSKVVQGIDDKNWYLFLVPDEGYSKIIELHDKLYTGDLARHLRRDIPFIPHMTVGIFQKLDDCQKAEDELNDTQFDIPGRIISVDVVMYEKDNLETIEQIALNQSNRLI